MIEINAHNEVENINGFSIPDIDASFGRLCNRAKLDTGTMCNYKCSFCYYIDKLDEVTEWPVIRDRIDFLASQGITEVDLSGGESSIHRDWFKILDYCTSKELKISCLSNGSRFADLAFMAKSKEHGLTEILFSLHGSNETTHDKLVGHKGAFEKILRAISNAKKFGLLVRVNCTVTEANYQCLSNEYVDLINDLDPFEVNFITLNLWEDQANAPEISYEDVTNEIKKSIDAINVQKSLKVNVRYTPFCYMKGYEKHVCGIYQHIYDVYDWNLAMYDYDAQNTKLSMFKKAKKNRLQFYRKPKECLSCKYFKICDGIDGHYPVYPEKGEYVQDVNYYRNDFYE